MSKKKVYGGTDLGEAGISTFFAHHECNEYCSSTWRKPRDKTAYYRCRRGSSMVDSSSDALGESTMGNVRPLALLEALVEEDEEEEEEEDSDEEE